MPTLTHGLSSAHFVALAAGFGDAECLAALCAGQASRRRLLLRAVADAAPSTAREALNLIREVAARDPRLADAALGHPLFAVWASNWLRERSGDTGYLTALAAAAAAKAGISFSLQVQTPDGSVTLPTLGKAVGIGPGAAMIHGAGDALVITGSERAVAVPVLDAADVPGWHVLRRVDLPAANAQVTIEDLDPNRDCFGWPAERRLHEDTAKRFGGLITTAWRLIEREHPIHAQAMRQSLRTLVPLATPPDGHGVSAASRLAFGAIAVCIPDDAETLAELFIHEFQHMKLGALLDVVDLYESGGPSIHWAPWRTDPRPVGALLQGTYAHVGVTDYWRMRQRRDVQSRLPAVEFGYWLAQTSRAAAILAGSGELTAAGQRLISQLKETLRCWHTELKPSIVSQVEDVADSAAIIWRLRNRTAPRDETARLARLFRAGAPCPQVAAAPTAVPRTAPGAARIELPISAPVCRHTIADYRDRLNEDPMADEAWVGLALALRRDGQFVPADVIIDRPELVRAIRQEVGGDPAEVAAWLSRGMSLRNRPTR